MYNSLSKKLKKLIAMFALTASAVLFAQGGGSIGGIVTDAQMTVFLAETARTNDALYGNFQDSSDNAFVLVGNGDFNEAASSAGSNFQVVRKQSQTGSTLHGTQSTGSFSGAVNVNGSRVQYVQLRAGYVIVKKSDFATLRNAGARFLRQNF